MKLAKSWKQQTPVISWIKIHIDRHSDCLRRHVNGIPRVAIARDNKFNAGILSNMATNCLSSQIVWLASNQTILISLFNDKLTKKKNEKTNARYLFNRSWKTIFKTSRVLHYKFRITRSEVWWFLRLQFRFSIIISHRCVRTYSSTWWWACPTSSVCIWTRRQRKIWQTLR